MKARHKPTFASVTAKPCTCNWARDMSVEPRNSVCFDEQTCEYQFVTAEGGRLTLYHCPFCGGAMPRSRRKELFAYVSEAEVDRLNKLISSVQSPADAIRVLGQPTEDMPMGMRVRTPAKGRRAPQVASYRLLTFTSVSKTADVELADLGPQGIRVNYRGKFLGKRRGRRTTRCS